MRHDPTGREIGLRLFQGSGVRLGVRLAEDRRFLMRPVRRIPL
jgi:hypothetical protein